MKQRLSPEDISHVNAVVAIAQLAMVLGVQHGLIGEDAVEVFEQRRAILFRLRPTNHGIIRYISCRQVLTLHELIADTMPILPRLAHQKCISKELVGQFDMLAATVYLRFDVD